MTIRTVSRGVLLVLAQVLLDLGAVRAPAPGLTMPEPLERSHVSTPGTTTPPPVSLAPRRTAADAAPPVGARPEADAVFRPSATGAAGVPMPTGPVTAADIAIGPPAPGRARTSTAAGDAVTRAFDAVVASFDRALAETLLAASPRVGDRLGEGAWSGRLQPVDAPVAALLKAAADYEAAGRPAQAVEMTRQAVTLRPDHPDVLSAHARAAAAAGLSRESRVARDEAASRAADGDAVAVRGDLRQVAALLRFEGAAVASHMPGFLYSAAVDLDRLLDDARARRGSHGAEWAALSLSQRLVGALIGSQEQAVAMLRRSLEHGAGNAAGWAWGIAAALLAQALAPSVAPPALAPGGGGFASYIWFCATIGAGVTAGRAMRARVRGRVHEALARQTAHMQRLADLRARLETPLV